MKDLTPEQRIIKEALLAHIPQALPGSLSAYLQ